MKAQLLSFVHVCVILALLFTLAPSGLPPTTAQARTGGVTPAASDPSAALIFIENAGQFAGDARFQVRGRDLTVWLAEDAIWLTLFDQSAAQSPTVGSGGTSGDSPSSPAEGVNIKLSFPGANPHPRLEPFNRLETHVSFFTGSDPAKWRAGVPAWGGVRYVELYPGIDLELTGEQGQLVPRLSARPGADLGRVRLRVDGADAVAVHGDTLHLSTSAGEAGYAWPLLRAEGSIAEASVQPRGALSFDVTSPFARAQHSQQSAIRNPQSLIDLQYSTFLGGSDSDWSNGIAVDGSGAAYVTGETVSSDFPTTPGAFDTSYNGSYDAFVVKLNPAGSALEYATFLGGDSDEYGSGIAVDGSGAAYVAGGTRSDDFPTTPGAFDTSFNGGPYGDAFVVQLNAAGSALDYSTFLGGSGGAGGEGIAVDGDGAAYVTGWTLSTDFPTTPGAFDTSYNGGRDTFVVKLNADGSALDYGTFLGGMSDDESYGIAVDGSAAAYTIGRTWSSDFPTTPGAYDTSHDGQWDGFVVKLNADGSVLDYGTFLGGSSHDESDGIAVDGSGAVYVTGYTSSSGFPTTPGAFDTSNNGSYDAFVVKLNPAGSALEYATFLGGSDVDYGRAIAVDGSGVAYVTGQTWSSDFPTTPGAFDRSLNGDEAFVLKLNAAGSALDYATFLGGSRGDGGAGIAVDESGVAYVTGQTWSSDLPTTLAAFDRTLGGYDDAFVVKLAMVPTIYYCSVYLPLVLLSPEPPDLLYGTFLGGSGDDYGYSIAVDASGAAYITGDTYSSDFPTTPGAFDTSYNGGRDTFVVKLNADGSALEYATFLGGSDVDYGSAIAVDGSGAVYVSGQTGSSDFPTTPGAFDRSLNGDEAFVLKLNAAGSALDYATFLGGSSGDGGRGIAVDESGTAYVMGDTWSSDFPTTPDAFDTSFNGGLYNNDAFVVKLNAAGSALEYATFVGGHDYDWGQGIAVDGSGAAYVTGYTASSDFPTTPGAFDTTWNQTDAFVVKLNAAGSALDYATFLGGHGSDSAVSIAVDGSGAAYVTGGTQSDDFPTTPGAFDTSFNGGYYGDAFVAKLNAAGSALDYATFLGGSSGDSGGGIAVDGSGAAYLTGATDSFDFPAARGAFDRSLNGDEAFVLKLNAAGSSLDYATFLGGSSGDRGAGIAVDESGTAYVTGYTSSSDFPTTPGAFDTSYNGGQTPYYMDAFVAKLDMGGVYLPLGLRSR